MSLQVAPYQASDIPGVKDFNRRLREGGGGFQFPEHVDSRDLPKGEGRSIYQEYFVASDGPIVRGGYILKTQPCSVRGELTTIGNYQLPLSEGIVDRAYGMVGVQILFDALKKQPKLYSLGMGGTERPLPQMLKKMGWHLSLVPFFFRVQKPQAFLREIVFLRANPKLKITSDILRFTGAGWVGGKIWDVLTSLKNFTSPLRSQAEIVSEFSEWTDSIWENAHGEYQWVGARDAKSLNILYPASDPRFMRLRIKGSTGDLGWILVMATRMRGHKQFGDMYVGSIVDGLARPEHAYELLRHATARLNGLGVDLIVSNQSHICWTQALRKLGYLSGPSNYAFACSPPLSKQIDGIQNTHINRGDGDGPINL